VAADVTRALAQSLPTTQSVERPQLPAEEYRAIPLDGKRKVIAGRTFASYSSAPHIALSLSVDMTQALHLCESLQAKAQARLGSRLTLTSVLVRTISAALLEHPRLNAHLIADEIRQFSTVHLGVAVAQADGLVVPVIRHVERHGLFSIQATLTDLTERARQGRLQRDEASGSTFTLSNLGMFGIEHFTAILNPPEVGILAVGVVQDTPVGMAGELVLRPMMQMTVNVDHRAIDGAVAAAFLGGLKERLENPYLLL
jgi:pyruvate dehydrogenase E2 component (dihydrolipoamide acetyltransferase)